MTNLLLLFLLLIIVVVLVLILVFSLTKNITEELIPPFRNTGFSTPELIRDCALYHTFSIEPAIVDQLQGTTYNPNDPYQCQDGSLKQLAKYTNFCMLDGGCIGLNGTLYPKGQRQYYYQTCGSEIPACDTLGVWFVNTANGQCLNVTTRNFSPCSPNNVLVYDDTIRQSALNSCLLQSLALSDCAIASNWFYSGGYLCSGNSCLSSGNNGQVVTVPDYTDSNLQLLLVPAR